MNMSGREGATSVVSFRKLNRRDELENGLIMRHSQQYRTTPFFVLVKYRRTMYTLPWLPFVVFDDDEMMSDDDDDDARTVMRIMIYSGGDEC